MPAMANITVKNAANADVVYVAATPSAGDRSPARWTLNGASGIIGYRPKMQVVTRDNGAGNGRRIEGQLTYPIVETIGGVATKTATVPFEFSGVLPTNVDATLVADAFTQFGNLLASSLMRSSVSEGYAPT